MSRNEMVQCPFDPNHKVCGARYQYHVAKCKEKFPELVRQHKICPYNARHWISMENYKDHLLNCPDRSVLFREIVKGKPVAEVVNKAQFGVVREPIEIPFDPTLEAEWGYSEIEGDDASESVASFDLGSRQSISRAESVASVDLGSRQSISRAESVASVDLWSTGSKVGAPAARIYPYSMGVGRCKGLKLDDKSETKCCGRAAFRKR